MEHISLRDLQPASSVVETTCPYCGVGCGVDVQIESRDGKVEPISVQGTQAHPANYGRLCVKGSQLLSTLGQDQRLAIPQLYGKPASWGQATGEIAERFTKIIDEHGPDAVAFYVSGQLLTEDYYVANKLMKGYIGSANIDTNSRLCMSSAVAAHKRAFGADAVPASYEDLEQTDLIVLIGSNAAWTHPVIFQRVERARKVNPNLKLVVIDPRRTASCEQADLHLQIKAGSDVPLFNGLLRYLSEHEGLDQAFISKSVSGFQDTLAEADSWPLNEVAQACEVDPELLKSFYALFAETPKVVSCFSMGINQSSAGVDKANSIINCHLASGKIGKPGCAPFSITGQPNAMGGREVGGLANLLAAHMDIANVDHRSLVQEFWQSPKMPEKPGLKAVDLFEAVESGKVKALWVMATNPLVSMPNRNQIERALQKCELVVVSDFVASNDTMAFADIKLPATSWSEKNGTVTNSDRTISRQRGFLPPFEEARNDWEIIADVATKMGYEGFSYQGVHEVFDEYCALTAYKNHGDRLLDLSGLQGMGADEYNALRPVQWPVTNTNRQGKRRLFEDGRFCTPDYKARCIPVSYSLPEQGTSDAYPFVLNSGRLRDQWHTMSRTGYSAALSQHQPRAELSIHPLDAEQIGVSEGGFVELSSEVSTKGNSRLILPIKMDSSLRQGELFAPIHWSKEWASNAAISVLYSSAKDPFSGQPELKHAAVALKTVDIKQHALIVAGQEIDKLKLATTCDVWSKAKIAQGFMYSLANFTSRENLARILVESLPPYEELVSHCNATSQQMVTLLKGRIHSLVFVDDQDLRLERDWLETLLDSESCSPDQIQAIIHKRIDEEFAQGRVVCSCYKVGEKQIQKAILEQGCHSVEALGRSLKCGTNCGSCKSELAQILSRTRPADETVVIANPLL